MNKSTITTANLIAFLIAYPPVPQIHPICTEKPTPPRARGACPSGMYELVPKITHQNRLIIIRDVLIACKIIT